MRILIVPLLLLTLGGFAGCGGGNADDVEMADVSGTVTLKGKPLADAEVYFLSGKYEGYGRTDEQGHYSLVRGAPVGECKVYVTKIETPDPKGSGIDLSIEGMDEEQLRAMAEGQGTSVQKLNKSVLPPEFSDPEKTKLTFDVPAEGTDQADFKL